MNMLKLLTFGVAASLLAASPAAADVQLTIQNGHVSLVAKDVTVRQILTEWARVGHTKIVNVERIPGGLVSLELRNVPEAQALDILLRSVSGYLAAPRAIEVAELSRFDRIASFRPAPRRARPWPRAHRLRCVNHPSSTSSRRWLTMTTNGRCKIPTSSCLGIAALSSTRSRSLRSSTRRAAPRSSAECRKAAARSRPPFRAHRHPGLAAYQCRP
jgi:hypothetical protein